MTIKKRVKVKKRNLNLVGEQALESLEKLT
jgi:hypothetical protein